jgi:hypothetical protein
MLIVFLFLFLFFFKLYDKNPLLVLEKVVKSIIEKKGRLFKRNTVVELVLRYRPFKAEPGFEVGLAEGGGKTVNLGA